MSDQTTVRILLYSDDRNIRQAVRFALGKSVAADLPEFELVEAATQPAALATMDAGGISLAILDGEAVPAGGMGLAHQLKDEIEDCPPILLLVARAADGWLATWSRAEAVMRHPVDPIQLQQQVATMLRQHLGDAPAGGEAGESADDVTRVRPVDDGPVDEASVDDVTRIRPVDDEPVDDVTRVRPVAES